MSRSLAVAQEAAHRLLYIPLDDRPVSLQLPQMLAKIAGAELLMPPAPLLGSYLMPGRPAELGAWLVQHTSAAPSFVLSSDMLGYGGLIASRVPGAKAGRVIHHFASLYTLRKKHRAAQIYTFGTVMRLAPTGVPKIGAAADFFAAGTTSVDIAAFANLPSPSQTEADRAVAATLRKQLGGDLDAYLTARRRNLRVDSALIDATADGRIDHLVLGQDDAGPVGVHLADIAALHRRIVERRLSDDQAAIESGTDELGMVLLARALIDQIHWRPRISVTYSRPGAQTVADHLEYEPIDATIGKLIRLSGGETVAMNDHPDINLFVYVAQTKREERDAFLASMHVLLTAGRPVTVADLSFIDGTLSQQSELVEAMLKLRLAAAIDGFASWNTDANSVGTALSAAIFTEVGKREKRYDPVAHAAFLLDRYADDYAYRLHVRGKLTSLLQSEGLVPTYFLPGTALRMESDARFLLWQEVVALRDAAFPDYALCRATITLPWHRTFETELQLSLQHKSQAVENDKDESSNCRSRDTASPL